MEGDVVFLEGWAVATGDDQMLLQKIIKAVVTQGFALARWKSGIGRHTAALPKPFPQHSGRFSAQRCASLLATLA
jgi:hypothetical protein